MSGIIRDVVGPSSGRKMGSGVLQLLSTVCESGVDSLVSLKMRELRGGVQGGDEGGGAQVEDDEVDDEDDGIRAGGSGGGLEGLELLEVLDGMSSPDKTQLPPSTEEAAVAPSTTFKTLRFCFLPNLLLPLVNKREEGEEAAEEEVEVVELGLTFFDLRTDACEGEADKCIRALVFWALPKSLFLAESETGSELGLRKGDRLSLSLRKTTAIDPPTSVPLLAPPWPGRSIVLATTPNLLELIPPVVLLTPSRTSTDTLDCSFPFREPLLIFFNLPGRTLSFFPTFSFSFTTFLAFFVALGTGSVRAGTKGSDESERGGGLFSASCWSKGSTAVVFLPARDLFLPWDNFSLGLVLVLGFGVTGGGGSAESPKEESESMASPSRDNTSTSSWSVIWSDS